MMDGYRAKKRFHVELFYRLYMLPKHHLTGSRRIFAFLFALSLGLFVAGCGKRTSTRIPSPPRPGETQKGIASWYGDPYHGRRAANGEVYDMFQLTAAHRKWPFETIVRVTNLTNHQEVDVRITDRGPFVRGRIIDLSRAAAEQIQMIGPGTAKVKLKVLRVETANYSVQVGVFREEKNAEAMRDRLRQFPNARMVKSESNPVLFRVLVGRETTPQKAEQLLARVRQEVPDAVVVKEP